MNIIEIMIGQELQMNKLQDLVFFTTNCRKNKGIRLRINR